MCCLTLSKGNHFITMPNDPTSRWAMITWLLYAASDCLLIPLQELGAKATTQMWGVLLLCPRWSSPVWEAAFSTLSWNAGRVHMSFEKNLDQVHLSFRKRGRG